MQVNWSLILNILLLVGVVIAIVRTLKTRQKPVPQMPKQPSIGVQDKPKQEEDIIAVRKVERIEEEVIEKPILHTHRPSNTLSQPQPMAKPALQAAAEPVVHNTALPESSSIMMFLLAKGNRQLAGYELLQTVLAAGLRFGEGQIFHRHQSPNGQGPVLCSLAAATATGTFDMQNIGACSVRGLCLFMHASGNTTIDAERFEIMLDTAKHLSENLDTHLLDDRRQSLNDASIERYHHRLGIMSEMV